MANAHEIAEKIEHAAHASHGAHAGHDGGVGRLAGITMAILGVMLALCAAMVGGERTDLISTMVEQSNTYGKYQAQRMKFRMTMGELGTLHALSPSHKELADFETTLAESQASAGPERVTVGAVGRSTEALVAILQPRTSDIERTLNAGRRYGEELEAAQKWAESYDEAVEAHFEASEHYEWGQLAAEIGIVIASVALLLSNRKAWYVSVAMGAICAFALVSTYVTTRSHLQHATVEVAETKAKYTAMRQGAEGKDADQQLLADVDAKLKQLEQQPPAEKAAPAASQHEPPKHL